MLSVAAPTKTGGSVLRKCPAHGCTKHVPLARAFCQAHWWALPAALRVEIWRAYQERPGSERHLRALSDARRWLREHP